MERTVGIVGVGNMGGAIAAHLLAQGWSVRVHDVDRARVGALASAGAVACRDSAETAEGVSLLMVCVVDAAQVREVLFGDDGAAAALAPGAAVMLCPTIAPADVEDISAALARQGVDAIDAPMSGGPARARDGSMSLMVACPEEVFERHRAVIEATSRAVFRIGERVGDGARTKLVNNLLAAINLVGAAEAIALAQRLGLDPRTTLEVIARSSGQSWIGSDRMRRAIEGDFAPRAHMTLLAKDTRLAIEAARDAGFDAALGTAARDTFARAVAAGLADLDDAAVLKLLSP
jgi:3-hydroxyisobutyrate dehydrogenase